LVSTYFVVKDALQRLVGEKNAQIGFVKMFETFQDKKLNKHLIHVSLFEKFLSDLICCLG
jgi:hypothetical protein